MSGKFRESFYAKAKRFSGFAVAESQIELQEVPNLRRRWSSFNALDQVKVSEKLTDLVAEYGNLNGPKVAGEMKRLFDVEADEVQRIWLAMRYTHDRKSQLSALQHLRKLLLDEFEAHKNLLKVRENILKTMETNLENNSATLKRYTSFIGPNHEGPILGLFKGQKLISPNRDLLEKNIDHALAEWNIYREDIPMHHFDEIVDLIFVGVISSMSYSLLYSLKKGDNEKTAQKIFDMLSIFFACFVLFTLHTVSVIRFTYGAKWNTDLCHFFYGLGLVLTAFTDSHSLSDNPYSIIAGISLSATSLFVIHIVFLIKRTIRGRAYTWRRIYVTALCLFILAFAFYPWGYKYLNAAIVILAFLPPLVVELNSFRVDKEHLPVTVEHTSERFGMFTVFCLGESLLATMNAYDGSFKHIVMMSMIFVIVFCVYKEVFEFWKQRVESHHHALYNSVSPGSSLWVFLHFPLSLCLIGNGFGFMFIMKKKIGEGLPYLVMFIPAIFVFLHFMRLCHVSTHFNWFPIAILGMWASIFPAVYFIGRDFFLKEPQYYTIICVILVLIYHYMDKYVLEVVEDSDYEEEIEHDHKAQDNRCIEDAKLHDEYTIRREADWNSKLEMDITEWRIFEAELFE